MSSATTTTTTNSAANPPKSPKKMNGKLSLFSHIKYEHMVAGISGGVTSTLILHPLDLIKIRFAVNDGRVAAPQYRGLSSAFVTIFRQEGFRGLYKGVTPNAWGSGSAWGFYFLFYNTIKGWIQGGNAAQPLGPALHMLAASEAGILTLLMTNPIWVVKTRLCLQYENKLDLTSNENYRGMMDGLIKIYKTEGVKGLYRGFVPGMFGVSHGALQFMTYEEMKNSYNEYRKLPIDTKLVGSMTSSTPEKRECLYKILVIGELGTGKTSFIKRYVHQFFSQNYRATIGVDFALKVLSWDESTIIRLQLWDIAGQERYGNMTRVYYKEAVGAFIVFDVTRTPTFDAVNKWKKDLDSKVQLPDGSPIPCILLANKCDQQKQGLVTMPQKMDEYCRQNGFAGWFETSAKDNTNIEESAKALVSKILLNDKLIHNDMLDGDRLVLDTEDVDKPKKFCSC